jgi:hypothetical protein
MALEFRMPVSELLERFSSDEITKWRAYFGVKGQEQQLARGGMATKFDPPQTMSGH